MKQKNTTSFIFFQIPNTAINGSDTESIIKPIVGAMMRLADLTGATTAPSPVGTIVSPPEGPLVVIGDNDGDDDSGVDSGAIVELSVLESTLRLISLVVLVTVSPSIFSITDETSC